MPICKVCDEPLDIGGDTWRSVTIVIDGNEFQVIVCNWCAQLIKETFEGN